MSAKSRRENRSSPRTTALLRKGEATEAGGIQRLSTHTRPSIEIKQFGLECIKHLDPAGSRTAGPRAHELVDRKGGLSR